MRNLFDKTYEDIFRHLVQAQLDKAEQKERQAGKWCAFWPAVGHQYRRGGVMMVGRALNGWEETTFATKQARSDDGIVAEKCRKSFVFGPECPVSWVESNWGRGQEYSTGRSALWRMAKKLIEFYGHSGEGWSGYLCWNNLMRLSPAPGGNPPAWSCNAQLPHARELLEREINLLAPGVIIAFVGKDWFDWFVADGEQIANVKPVSGCRYVTGVGDMCGAPVVVAPHPMKKKEDVLMSELKRFIPSVLHES